MAVLKSKTFSAYAQQGANTQAYQIFLEISQLSKDINTNKSQVRFHAWMKFTPGGNATYNNFDGVNTYWMKVNGTTVINSTHRVDFRSTYIVEVADVTRTIAHNADGSCTVTGEAYQYIDDVSAFTYAQVSGSLALETIPRATTPTVPSSAVMGNTISIETPRASSTFTHDLYYKFGTMSDFVLIASGVATSYSWTIPDLATYLTTAGSGICQIKCITKDSSGTIGEVINKSLNLSIPSDVVPTVTSVTATEQNSKVSNVLSDDFLKTLSNILLSINGASGAKGSTISKYNIYLWQNGSQIAAYNTQTKNWIPDITGAVHITANVVDSRGRTSNSVTADINILNYRNPIIELYDVLRCDSSGAELVDGNYSKHFIKGNICSVVSGGVEKNSIRYKVQKIEGTTYTDLFSYKTVLNTSVNTSEVVGTFDPGTAFQMYLNFSDAFGQTAYIIDYLPIAAFTGFLGKKGMSFTGVYDETDTKGVSIQAYDTVHFLKDVTFELGLPTIEITSGTDLNTLTKPGLYYCASNTTVGTLVNCPIQRAFSLLVSKHCGTMQEITEFITTNPIRAFRNFYNGEFGSWYKLTYTVL